MASGSGKYSSVNKNRARLKAANGGRPVPTKAAQRAAQRKQQKAFDRTNAPAPF